MAVWQTVQITSSRGLGATCRGVGGVIGAVSKSSSTSFIKSAIKESSTSVSCLFLMEGLLAPGGGASVRESVYANYIKVGGYISFYIFLQDFGNTNHRN